MDRGFFRPFRPGVFSALRAVVFRSSDRRTLREGKGAATRRPPSNPRASGGSPLNPQKVAAPPSSRARTDLPSPIKRPARARPASDSAPSRAATTNSGGNYRRSWPRCHAGSLPSRAVRRRASPPLSLCRASLSLTRPRQLPPSYPAAKKGSAAAWPRRPVAAQLFPSFAVAAAPNFSGRVSGGEDFRLSRRQRLEPAAPLAPGYERSMCGVVAAGKEKVLSRHG